MSVIQNLIPDPRFKTGRWYAQNSTVTPIPEHDAVNVANTNGDEDSFMEFTLVDVSQYLGVSMTFACSLTAIDGSAKECLNRLLFVYNSGGWQTLASDGGTAKVGRKTLQFTLPGNSNTISLRLYAPGERGTFQWRHPMLTRTEDYQRMLNGIWGQPMDYFDGDTMPRQ